MNPIFLKKIKLFKIPAILQKKNNIPPPQEKEKSHFWKRLFQSPFLFLFIFVLALAYFISYLPSKSLPMLEEGEIASSDIIAPKDLTIEDMETTEKRRKEAVEAVLPSYRFDQNAFLNTEEKIRQFFSLGREWLKNEVEPTRKIGELQKNIYEKFELELEPRDLASLIRANFSSELEEILISLLGQISSQGIILSKNLFIHGEQEKGFTLAKTGESERSLKVSDILDIKESKERLASEIIKLDISQRNKSLLISLSELFVAPNSTYNKVETEARKERARRSVETAFYTIKKGKVIVRKGDEVTSETLKWIRLINQTLRAKPSWLMNFLGTFFIFGLLFITLWYYLKSLLRFRQAFIDFLMMGITCVLSLVFYKLSIFLAGTFSQSTNFFLLRHGETYNYAFPYQFGVLLFAFLTSNPVAVAYAIVNSLLVGYLLNANFHLIIFSLIGGFAAIYGIKYYERQSRTSIFRAGLFLIAPVNIFVIISIHLIKEELGGVAVFSSEILMGLTGGLLSAALAFLFLPVFENVFGFITQTKLLDLTNSDLPIFRQLALEAPGSYHHSLIVASLAEKAAEEIKLDSMLVKASALYHDIGKMKRPEYFIENRNKSIDLHKDLTPSMSTLVIINHVKEGVEMAKKLNLPQRIKEIIEQHHGSSLVRYFYQKAKEKYNPNMQKIGEESYRYPGPPPQTKEAALIMLADSVEAASRSLKSPSKETLKRVITEIFDNYLQDGQLDDCNFSIRELKTIASSFLSTLYTVYHPRVEYPGFDFELKKKKKIEKEKKADDRNHQPPNKILDQSKKI